MQKLKIEFFCLKNHKNKTKYLKKIKTNMKNQKQFSNAFNKIIKTKTKNT